MKRNSHWWLIGCLACAPTTPPTPPAALCHLAVVDTTGWQSVNTGLVTLMIPPGLSPDTGVMADLEFYHGGGRWRNDSLTVEYAPIGQTSWNLPPWTASPGELACWEVADGLEVKIRTDRTGGRYVFRAWVRLLTLTDRWTFVLVSGSKESQQARLVAILLSIRPALQ